MSVIIPARDARAFLARAVASATAQTYPEWEALVVADDGTDYRTVLEAAGCADERVRCLATERPGSGPGAARNRGLAVARGEFVAPLDADDLFYPARLACLLPLARAHGMAGDNVKIVRDPGGEVIGTLFPPGSGVRWLDLEACGTASTPMTFVFRRDVIAGPWDERFRFGEDTLFNLRALESVGRVPVLETPLHEYRVHGGYLPR